MGTPTSTKKKLRRLPHVFSRVLELPLTSDADVSVEERSDCFRFVSRDRFMGRVDVRAHMVEIHPGVKKVVVKGNCGLVLVDEMKLDTWRFRLPANAWPEAARAVCCGGELVVTVPKTGGGGRGSMGSLVNLH